MVERGRLATLVMVGPALGLFIAMLVVPIGLSVYLSLTDWDGYNPNPVFVGFDNYVQALTRPDALRAAFVTLTIAAVGSALVNVLGLGLALALNRSNRMNRLLRSIFFYPHVLSVLVVGFLWAAILGTNGAVNSVLSSNGLDKVPFLSHPTAALASLIGVVVWATFGVNLVLYLAGLQTVSKDLIESARIDGAGRVGVLANVTLPALRPTVTVNIVLSLVILLKTYDVVVSLTGGGPAGRTRTAAYAILWDSFHTNELGFGSAQAVILMVVTAALAVSVIRMRARGADVDVGGVAPR